MLAPRIRQGLLAITSSSTAVEKIARSRAEARALIVAVVLSIPSHQRRTTVGLTVVIGDGPSRPRSRRSRWP
ncbi:hypothetical protein V3N99_07475 [Dermatophilaceae bacterium Soc4.6]